jgi:UDP-galactopyranose mutase
MRNIVVGAGFAGATMANLIASRLGDSVLVIDRRDHIAGNSYDYWDKSGICVHKYGSHILHTNSEKVWNYLKQFCDFNQYAHKVIAIIDGIETTIPFNINSLYDVLPRTLAQRLEEKLLNSFEYNKKIPIWEFQGQNDSDLKFLADYVYEKVFLHYTTKQWGISPKNVDETVMARVPIYISKDNRYFQDKYQGIPLRGYTDLIGKMLKNPRINVQLKTDFRELPQQMANDARIFYTGSIDEFFDYKFGQLPYRSLNFKFETHEVEFYQSNSVVNYPCNYDFTRIHEYKYYLNNKSGATIIAKEYSEQFEVGKNERYYPIISSENQILYEKYLSESGKNNVYFLGRLGDYKYYDMDDAVERAVNLFEEIYR